MRPRTTLLYVAGWLVVSPFLRAEETAIIYNEPLVEGRSFTSPDGKYTATFLGGGFSIKQNDDGESSMVYSLPPVYKAAWTGDSKIFATIEHLAGGTDAALFFQKDGAWMRSDTTPDTGTNAPYQSYQVVSWEVGQTGVQLTYKVTVANGAIAKGPRPQPQQVKVPFDAGAVTLLNSLLGPNTPAIMFSPSGPLSVVPKSGAPVEYRGTLAVDTDGCGPSHGDPDQQKHASAMIDHGGNLVPRFLDNGKLNPAGLQEVDADVISYGVAPKNLASVNGGPLRVGDRIEIICPNGKHTTVIGDFGPPGKYGETSYHAIKDFAYYIVESQFGPLPSPDGTHTPDIRVTVKYLAMVKSVPSATSTP